MSHTAAAAVTGLLIFAASVWLGGYVAIAVVARVATSTMEPATRATFFRGLGRSYGVVGTVALAVAYGSGAALLFGRSWSPLLIVSVLVAAALVLTTAYGVRQARKMGRLRRRSFDEPDDRTLGRRVRAGARRAAALRAGIGVLSVTLLALGVALAT
ncbi:MAG TPA: hypothetical protein VFL99_06570 [Segeticoccus sp.]|uniref:hypothetical protein n=1 Tax=Segeticoccus sp. TaxID=2706531 RepID=UPI002D7EFE1C|nr:hypothetical protein [Segeticoccus sp.]HET8599972.1 hypothetical protein [Segeticoccus sp.]